MRKIIIIGSFPLSSAVVRGGVEASTLGLAVELSHSAEVAVLDFPRKEVDDGAESVCDVRVYRFHLKGDRNRDAVSSIPDMLRIISGIHPDLCHIHGTSVFSYRMLKSLEALHYPVLLTVHGLMGVEAGNEYRRSGSLRSFAKYAVQRYYERRLLGACRQVVADTGYVKKSIERLNLHRSPDVAVIPQGIDDRFFSYRHVDCGEQFIVFSLGAFSERKSHLKLMEAFELLWRKAPQSRLVIAGCATDEGYYRRMVEMKSSMDSREVVSILRDVDDLTLKSLYENASIFALHTQEESQGIVFAEAMACGLPVVTTNVGGVPWVVENKVNGLLSDYGDIATFAEHMYRMVSDVGFYQRVSSRNSKDAAVYSWHNIASELSVLFESLYND